MIVAVTGASGFCGAAVVRRLEADGHEVVVVGRRPAGPRQWRMWDAATDTPDLGGTDAVVHLAAAVGDPRPGASAEVFDAVNVDGAQGLLDVVGGRRVVWVSSSSVYDPTVRSSPVREDHPTAAGHLNDYGRTKAVGDRLAREAGAVVLRPRAVYGPGDVHLLPRLRQAVRVGRVVMPGADIMLSVTHVDNLADACAAALDWEPGPYNVTDPAPVWRDAALTAVLSAAVTRPLRVARVPIAAARAAVAAEGIRCRLVPADPRLTAYSVDLVSRSVVLDITRARSTGWTPRDLLPGYLEWLRDRSVAGSVVSGQDASSSRIRRA
jgi:nucleoside-diphosphate-sugar epimerase